MIGPICLVDKTFVGRFMTHPEGGLISGVVACPAPLDYSLAITSCAEAFLVQDWYAEISRQKLSWSLDRYWGLQIFILEFQTS